MFGSTLSSCLAANSYPLDLPQKSPNSFAICSYKKHARKFFRICSYKKTGGGGGSPTRAFSHSLSCSSFALSLSFARAPRKLPIFNTLRTLCTIRPRRISRNPSLFNHLRTLVENIGGCAPLRSSPCKFFPTHRTNLSATLSGALPSEPLHLALHGGTISAPVSRLTFGRLSGSRLATSRLARETFPLSPVSNSRERTTGSTARLIQQSARDRRPGPLAIRGRHPDLFAEKGRPGKASSVRLGERSIVGS